MSAILLDYTFQTSSPFIDTAINELLRHRAIHSSKIARLPVSAVPHLQTVIVIHSLLQGSQHCIVYTRFKSGLFAGHITGSIKVTFRSAGS